MQDHLQDLVISAYSPSIPLTERCLSEYSVRQRQFSNSNSILIAPIGVLGAPASSFAFIAICLSGLPTAVPRTRHDPRVMVHFLTCRNTEHKNGDSRNPQYVSTAPW